MNTETKVAGGEWLTDLENLLQNISTAVKNNIPEEAQYSPTIIGPGGVLYSNDAFIANRLSRDQYEQSDAAEKEAAAREQNKINNTIIVVAFGCGLAYMFFNG